MHLRTLRRGRNLVAAAATLGLLGLPLLTSPAEAAPSKSKAPAIKVMTRNVYLGADIMRPIKALQSVAPSEGCAAGSVCYRLKALNAFGNANDQTRDIVDETDFETRATLLAEELVTAKPDLVGLQEVALWRSGAFEDPLTSPTFVTPNATTVDLDFLKILLKELKAQGVVYKALSVNTLSDVEGPAFEGSYGNAETFKNERDVRLTMRDVILVRKDSAAKVVKAGKERTYETNMPAIVVEGKSIEFKRGYQWVDMKIKDRKFRFINTHLEAFSSDVAYAQAQELIDGPGAYKGRTIMVCDCNSDPANGSIKTGQGDTKRHWAPYFLIKREGDFHDTWLQWAPPEEGFTSGLEETVDDAEPTFTHRIDLVMARTKKGDKLPVLDGDVTGDELEDSVLIGDRRLWPSDHAGVVTKLRLR